MAVILRLWEERDDWLAKALIVLMGVPALLALQAILLPFMAAPRGSVRFNWKLTTTLFASAFLIDICMTIFAVQLVKARKKKQ